LDGAASQGVLYKPDNFDSSKKYSVIINFYGGLSDRLYQFLDPRYLNTANLFDQPAWLVSRGYLVFIPDIQQTAGQWGASTVNTIDGAAKYLSTLPYVDNHHLGAAGHSNSGTLGYYLFTHSHSFAAISIGSDTTNLISKALSSLNWLNYFEIGSEYVPGYVTDLWKHKAEWIDQTAVLSADKVTMPLLMNQNKNDQGFEWGIELFISLRRLNKPVWWLQYDEGEHVLTKLRDRKDFTIRYTQFFDHYLKGAPAPAWMLRGIPNELKGVQSRYELE
jgi:dipeptidyl aminopeptidase/acylaminoacyl peptidase